MRLVAALLYLVAGCSFTPGSLDHEGTDAGRGGHGEGSGTQVDAGPSVARSCKVTDSSLRLCLEMDDRRIDPMVIDGSPQHLDSASTDVAELQRGPSYAAAFAPGSRIQVPESAALDLSGAFTIEMWVAPLFPHSATVLSNLGQYYIQIAGDGRVGCILPNAQLWSSDEIDAGEWTHIACTFEAGSLKVFIDGAQRGQQTFQSPGMNGNGANGTVLGGNNFTGGLDDIRIYGRALTASEVCGRAGRTSCTSGPGGGD